MIIYKQQIYKEKYFLDHVRKIFRRTTKNLYLVQSSITRLYILGHANKHAEINWCANVHTSISRIAPLSSVAHLDV